MATSSLIESPVEEVKMLSELRSALLDGIRKCSEVVFNVRSESLKKTILHLELQSTQYANELRSQIEMLGGNPSALVCEEGQLGKGGSLRKSIKTQSLVLCKNVERSVIGLYKKMLSQELKNEGLKSMMKYQMDGMMCLTLQLKLLTKFLHNQ